MSLNYYNNCIKVLTLDTFLLIRRFTYLDELHSADASTRLHIYDKRYLAHRHSSRPIIPRSRRKSAITPPVIDTRDHARNKIADVKYPVKRERTIAVCRVLTSGELICHRRRPSFLSLAD